MEESNHFEPFEPLNWLNQVSGVVSPFPQLLHEIADSGRARVPWFWLLFLSQRKHQHLRWILLIHVPISWYHYDT